LPHRVHVMPQDTDSYEVVAMPRQKLWFLAGLCVSGYKGMLVTFRGFAFGRETMCKSRYYY
ncbi:hypothetical protein, partial [Hymenobacter coalescens]